MLIKDFLRFTAGIAGKNMAPVVRRLDRGLTVFVFHDVSDDPAPFTRENDACVSTKLFRSQLRFISENFNVVSAESWLKGDTPKRPAMVTFDDGYQGIFKCALPLLKDMGLPAVIFMNMGPVIDQNYWAERATYLCQKVESFQQFLIDRGIAAIKTVEQAHVQCTQALVELYEQEHGDAYLLELPTYIEPYATLEDLEEADDNPLVTFGSHLYTHFNVRNLTDQVLNEEYQKNELALSRFKQNLPIFAFPFGQPDSCFSMEQARFLLNNGAIRLFTAWPRPNYDHTAKIIDRISFDSRHNSDWRMWNEVVKYPLLEIFKGPGSASGARLEALDN